MPCRARRARLPAGQARDDRRRRRRRRRPRDVRRARRPSSFARPASGRPGHGTRASSVPRESVLAFVDDDCSAAARLARTTRRPLAGGSRHRRSAGARSNALSAEPLRRGGAARDRRRLRPEQRARAPVVHDEQPPRPRRRASARSAASTPSYRTAEDRDFCARWLESGRRDAVRAGRRRRARSAHGSDGVRRDALPLRARRISLPSRPAAAWKARSRRAFVLRGARPRGARAEAAPAVRQRSRDCSSSGTSRTRRGSSTSGAGLAVNATVSNSHPLGRCAAR